MGGGVAVEAGREGSTRVCRMGQTNKHCRRAAFCVVRLARSLLPQNSRENADISDRRTHTLTLTRPLNTHSVRKVRDE